MYQPLELSGNSASPAEGHEVMGPKLNCKMALELRIWPYKVWLRAPISYYLG